MIVLCLLVSLVSPAAFAVDAGADSVTAAEQSSEANNTASKEISNGSDLIVTGENAANYGMPSLRGQETAGTVSETEDTQKTGSWTATPAEGYSAIIDAQLPESIQELRDAADVYDENDIVAAFIVMESKPLAESYRSINSVPAAKSEALLTEQNAVINTIEKTVLDGEELNVRYQFTYLTNSVSVRVPFGQLEEIAAVDGVASVFIMPVYNTCEVEQSGMYTASSGEMVGAPTVWNDLGYTGTGMKIAVIDSGLDLDHPSFAADPELNDSSLSVEDISAVLSKLNASKRYSGLTAEDLYYSAKVPYAFNYVDENLTADHSSDDQGYHGTHVAGIAAANYVEGSGVVGVAPDAQIVVMKVFGANGGAYTDDIVAAIQDAMVLGCDVVNMSLGSPDGFTTASEEVDAIYARIAKQDIIVNVSAGNESVSSSSNLWGTDLNLTSDPDNATVSSPATYANTTVVASAENANVVTTYFTVDGTNVGYVDAQGLYVTFDSLAGQDLEYVMVPGLGEESDFAQVDVSGKIAVVSRGTISFALKLANAEAAGAIGLVVYNNEAGSIAMTMMDDDGNLLDGVSGMVPAVSISKTAGENMAAVSEKKLTVAAEEGLVASDDAGQMSYFSSWGVSPDLQLMPDVTGIGGNVYSTADEGEYVVMSGTSMSSPQVAGVSALVLQYIHENYENLSDSAIRVLAASLIMCTAEPIISSESSVEVSPRQQGAGLVNAAAAVTSGAYLSASGNSKPKVELGDDVARTGEYTFTFNIHNLSDEDKTYALDASVLTEDYVEYDGYEFMAGYDRALESDVTFSQDTVTVKANSVVTVSVTVKLTDAGKAWLDEHYVNGGYVEGFVYLNALDEKGVDMSLPFLGFYGDWTEAPVLDSGFWYDEMFWADEWNEAPTGSQYFNVPWVSLGGSSWVLGLNPYTGEFDGYDADHFVISNNGDGYLDGFEEIYFAQMRNAKNLNVTFSDAETGEIYFYEPLTYANKTMYISAYGTMVPTLYSWYSYNMYDFTDSVGAALPNNAVVELSVYANLDYSAHAQNNDFNAWSVPITIDVEAPHLVKVETVAEADGNYVVVTVADNTAVAGIQLVNIDGTRLLADYSTGLVENEDGTVTVKMDVTGLGEAFVLILGDYGVNESAYTLTYTLDDNRPEMDESLLYAYRLFDAGIYSDHMYGWTTIDPETAEVVAQTDDYMEYYALTAAEYAAGYVFGIDAGNNLVVMIPGLWNRTTIRNLGEGSYLDMTFDKTTNTMYALWKHDGYYIALVTIDLLTGATETVRDYGYYYYGGAWAMAAADDGTIYAVRYGSGTLYTIDTANGYEMAPVLNQDGEEVVITTPGVDWEGNEIEVKVAPGYSQSMTWQDGKLYWAYYPSDTYYTSLFITVDTETYEITTTAYENDSEFVGLLTLGNDVADYDCDEWDCPSAAFVDIRKNVYYHEAVDFMVLCGYMNGTSENTFEPYTNMTRGMLMTVLHRMSGSPEVTGENPFTDSEGYFQNAITWAYENGIANGYSETEFAPRKDISRQELATFLYRYAAWMGCDVISEYSSLAQFQDAGNVSGFALPAVRWAVAEGLINGVSEDTLDPKGTATRAQTATVLYRLYTNVLGGYTLPTDLPLSEIVLSDTELLLAVDTQAVLEANPLPWNTTIGEITWTSSDETVATVENGVVTAVGAGNAVITAAVGELSAVCDVTVVSIEGDLYAYNYYNDSGDYNNWIHIDLADADSYDHMFTTAVDFVAAEYNGHQGLIYGYDANSQFYCYDPNTGAATALGDPINVGTLTDMAYDYSTGFMYLAVLNTNYITDVYYVNLNTGAVTLMASSGYVYMTLACSTDGQLYAVTADGSLITVTDVYEDYLSGSTYMLEEVLIEGLPTLNYGQSMAYDHNSGNLIWACPEAYSLIWMDPDTGDYMYLGNPTGGYLFQFYGLFTIPDTIPELPYVAVEGLNAEDMLVMEGSTKAINFTIAPLNATNQDIYWSTSDPSVATVDSTGAVTGRNLGTATISGILFDGDNTFTTEFTVTVIASAGMLRGHVLTDMASYGGQFWIEFPDANPSDITYLGDCYYTLFAEEYYNGKIYAYGYDYMDWEGNWQFFTINPDTFEIESMTDMGEGFPYVYDMTYDYSSRIMYATAGYNETDSDLYIVDMVSGTLIPLMATDVSFMGLAADGKGNLYGISRSEEAYDPWSWSYTFSDACLYKIDVEAGELELIGSTGKKCNKIASMTIDYDTGNLYWAQLFQQDYFSPVSGGLCYVDLETGAATSLGLIGSAGCQMAGLYSLADNFPEEPELALSKLLLSDSQMVLSIGSTAQIGAYAIPTTVPAELTWTSSDESVVSVDNTGLVTALKQGVATITVTAVYGETTATASCEISVLSEDACFLTYSLNQYGWVKVDRGNINSAEVVTYDDYDAAPVLSMEYVNGTIYGYDTDGNFFSTTDEGDNAFVRTVLGAWDVTPEAGSGEVFEVRDLAYDAKNDRLLALGCLGHPAYGGILGGEKIYEVNLTTGGLTEVCTLEELYNCGGFAVDGNGNGYVYSSYDDGIYTLDLTTGLTVSITTLQTQSLYGDTESVHAMSYDSASGKLYLLFTSNGAVRQLVTMNTADYSLVNLGIFGQVMEDPWGGTSYDFYNGLIIKN